MPHWGYLLLAVYVGLGVGRATHQKATQVALLVTALGITYAMHSYGAL